MSPESFRAACIVLWGGEWRLPARQFLQCSDRNLSRFASGSKPVGEDFERDLFDEIRRVHDTQPTEIMVTLAKALGTNPA